MDSLELKCENDETQDSINIVTTNKSIIHVGIDDCVHLRNGKIGIVKYIGEMEFMKGKLVIGILMNEWSQTNSNGIIEGKKYFQAKDGYGYFAHPSEIIENLSMKTKTKDNTGVINVLSKSGYGSRVIHCNVPKEVYDNAKRLDDMDADTDNDRIINPNDGSVALISCKYGDRICVVGDYIGVVKFIGTVHFNDSKMIGVELDNICKSHGHNSTIDTREYYRCKKGGLMFVHPQDVIENLGTNNINIANNSLENKDCSNDGEYNNWNCSCTSHQQSEDELQLNAVHLDDRFRYTQRATVEFGRYYGERLSSIAHINLPKEFWDAAKRLDDDEDDTRATGIDDTINIDDYVYYMLEHTVLFDS